MRPSGHWCECTLSSGSKFQNARERGDRALLPTSLALARRRLGVLWAPYRGRRIRAHRPRLWRPRRGVSTAGCTAEVRGHLITAELDRTPTPDTSSETRPVLIATPAASPPALSGCRQFAARLPAHWLRTSSRSEGTCRVGLVRVRSLRAPRPFSATSPHGDTGGAGRARRTWTRSVLGLWPRARSAPPFSSWEP